MKIRVEQCFTFDLDLSSTRSFKELDAQVMETDRAMDDFDSE